MSSFNIDTIDHPQDELTSPTRAYYPPTKSSVAPITSALSAALSEKLAATLASKKVYINLPSIHKVIASHTNKKSEEANVPDYDEAIANIPVLDLLPPPPVYDIVNCPTSQTLLLVSSLINTILAVNDRLACPKITLFHSRAIPNISIEAYLSRILQYAPFQNEVLLIILLYFDRIGGGCKPTQVLTNTIPKSLLRQASLTSEDINQLTAPKSDRTADFSRKQDEKSDYSRLGLDNSTSTSEDTMDEDEEPIVDEIYTSSSESPVGSKLIINSFNIHRLLITSILVASKFSSDVFYPNVRYARVGGLPLTELNQLELEFLFLSQFELNTTEAEIQTYGNKLLMYHQRLNGTERAASDAITPARGEYVRLSEKKHIVHDSKHIPPRIQTSVQPQQRLSTDMESKPFVSTGPYRDSKEFIDDDEVMSEKGDDNVGSPTDWQSAQSTPVRTEMPSAKYPPQRSNKMNLDHMIWPTNDMDTKYSSSYYGVMEKDEDAARIEEEFKKASPPPESGEPNPKRKLQRLSSGTLETVPAKRVNTPSKTAISENKTTSQSASSNNKNILRPLFRKIASFANRSDATPTPEPEQVPQSTLRSHPYLVRHPVAAESSNDNGDRSEDTASPTTPTSRGMLWQHTRAPHPFQSKPPPPPYSGEGQDNDVERNPHEATLSVPFKQSGAYRGRRYHRSREPSLSSLASELTFEPTRANLSSMCEETDTGHPTTLAPFYFPPKPQTIEGARNPQLDTRLYPDTDQDNSSTTSALRNERSNDGQVHEDQRSELSSPMSQMPTSPSSDLDDDAMQCDEPTITSPKVPSKQYYSEPLAVSITSSAQGEFRMRSSQKIEIKKSDGGLTESSKSLSLSSRASETNLLDSRHWAPGPNYPPAQHPHPHYVAAFSPSNAQLSQNPVSVTMMGSRPSLAPAPRNPQALPGTSSNANKLQVPLTTRPTRQFAPIRPRTPMTADEESKTRTTTEQTSSNQKKKKSSTETKAHQQPQSLRPLVPAVMTPAPPPYRPPFIAYTSPYTHQLCAPDGSPIRPPAPMIMAVDYSRGGAMTSAHGPQFIAAPQGSTQGHPGAPRLYIPIIPVMYNKSPAQLASATPLPSGKTSGKSNTPAKIAPRLHHAT